MRTRDIDSSVKDLEHAIKVLKHARTQPNVSTEDRQSQEARRKVVCGCMIRAFKRIKPIQSASGVSVKVLESGSPKWTILELFWAILCQA